MTETERNELVEKLVELPLMDWERGWAELCIKSIESLGYEIVKKKPLQTVEIVQAIYREIGGTGNLNTPGSEVTSHDPKPPFLTGMSQVK